MLKVSSPAYNSLCVATAYVVLLRTNPPNFPIPIDQSENDTSTHEDMIGRLPYELVRIISAVTSGLKLVIEYDRKRELYHSRICPDKIITCKTKFKKIK